MNWRVLVVGVDHAPTEKHRLLYAEQATQILATWLSEHLDPHRCDVHVLRAPTRHDVDLDLDWLAKAKNRLLVWTGHMERWNNGHYLVTGETSKWNDTGRMISLRSLAELLATDRHGATTVVLLDACYAGAIDVPALTDGTVPGVSMVLAATLPGQMGVEHSRDAHLASVFLSVLSRKAEEGRHMLDLVSICEDVESRLKQRGQQPTLKKDQRLEVSELPLLDARARLPRLSSLEQALGFATRAFHDYLNREVVSGVDVMYFLGYDPWDGCLVYDGLVPGSVEQCLLDSVRLVFLQRDRLRSRFAEYRASDTSLGPAGQCFSEALAAFDAEMKASKRQSGSSASSSRSEELTQVFVGRPWFMANLNESTYGSSEFRSYDRLLGLTCCLYLPIVISDPSQANRPMGGVIMAASTRQWGLLPKDQNIEQHFATFRTASITEPETELPADGVKKRDRSLAAAMAQTLRLPRLLDDNNPRHDMDDFLRCIAAVQSERTAFRWRIRRAVHPVPPKAVVRLLRDDNPLLKKQRENVINEVSRLLDGREDDPIHWFVSLETNGIDKYLPQNLKETAPDLPDDECREILREYLGMLLWRDLKLSLRNGRSEIRPNIQKYLKENVATFLGRRVVENWMTERSNARRSSEEAGRAYKDPGDIRAFEIDTLNDLIDELRDSDGPVFETLVTFLNEHGPIHKYVKSIQGLQPVLDTNDHDEFLDDLAHTVQVYLLGLWLMFSKDSGGQTLGQDAAVNISRFFKDSGWIVEVEHLQDRLKKSGKPDYGLIRQHPIQAQSVPKDTLDELGLWWGIVATMHDIGVPVQRFEQWGRQFFQRYFDQDGGRWLSPPGGALAKLLMHPRFPVYKSAIAGLHRERDVRDWLDALFCRQLSAAIDHSFAGALILVNELEPDGRYSFAKGASRPLWCRIPERLEEIYGTVGTEHVTNLERELIVPAYLAHSIALGNRIENSFLDEAGDRVRRRYFDDKGTGFCVDFGTFPLTWLVALCDVLAIPSIDLEKCCAELKDCIELKDLESCRSEVGASPFYVRRIEAGPEPKSLKLTLEPWGVSAARLSSREERSVEPSDINALVDAWRRTVYADKKTVGQIHWVVYSDRQYEDRVPRQESSLPPLTIEPTKVVDEHVEIRREAQWVEIAQDYALLLKERRRVMKGVNRGRPYESIIGSEVTHEYHVRRRAFDIVQAHCRLDELQEFYNNSDWAVEIHFSNVDKAGNPLVRVGRQNDPARDAWESTYHKAGERLWPTEPRFLLITQPG